METKTTIQISDEIRRRLKVISSQRDVSYENVLDEILDVFEYFIPFKDLGEFSVWFEKNLGRFGCKKVLEKRKEKGYFHYLVEDEKGVQRKAALQIVTRKDDMEHFKSEKIQMIVCVFSKEKSSQITALSQEVFERYGLLKNADQKTAEIAIPRTVESFFSEKVKTTGFSSVSDYITYILRQVIANYEKKDEGTLSKEQREKVRENLRGLGYLE
ncbi:MAG TPA: hypothetical protein VJJ21_03685 [Candidatus Nanoarchaeia archaeon]|nr:hypothetical protein [Candidatus Nanoarchaeia archaeon]